jgi:hypothetical protein
MMDITRGGLDIAKQVFQVHLVNERGAVKGRKTLPRARVLVTRAHEMCWARRWRIPAHRSIERRVLEAVRRVETADMEALNRVLRPEEMERLYKKLVEGRAHGASVHRAFQTNWSARYLVGFRLLTRPLLRTDS